MNHIHSISFDSGFLSAVYKTSDGLKVFDKCESVAYSDRLLSITFCVVRGENMKYIVLPLRRSPRLYMIHPSFLTDRAGSIEDQSFGVETFFLSVSFVFLTPLWLRRYGNAGLLAINWHPDSSRHMSFGIENRCCFYFDNQQCKKFCWLCQTSSNDPAADTSSSSKQVS